MRINNSIHRIPAPENRLFWFCVLLIMKFTVLYFLVNQNRPTQLPDTIAVCSGDCDSYLVPIDNLVSGGSYEPDFRMPGYGFVYMFFRLFTDKDVAVNLLVVFQTVLDALAAYYLSISLLWLTSKKSGFYTSLFLYGVGVTVSCYNNWIMTESLTSSALIFGFYFLLKFSRDKKNIQLIFSGFFFTWSYFLRPVNIVILAFAAFVLIVFLVKEKRIKYIFLFLLPALILNSTWSIRNYISKGKPYLLTENVYIKSWYGDYGLAGLEFCKTFSDFKITYNFFESRGLTYFGQAIQRYTLEDIKIPKAIYTPDFNYDSLVILQKLYKEMLSQGITLDRRYEIESVLTNRFESYTASIKKYHPYIAYVKTPLLLTKSFLLQSGVHNLFFMPYSHLSSINKFIKLCYIFIYVLSFGLFISGLLFYKQLFENKMILLSYVIAFYIIFIHSIFLRSIEPRYIIPAYPFFVIAAVYMINSIINSFNKQRING